MRRKNKFLTFLVSGLTIFSASLCTLKVNYGFLDSFYKMMPATRVGEYKFSAKPQSTSQISTYFMNNTVNGGAAPNGKTDFKGWVAGNPNDGSYFSTDQAKVDSDKPNEIISKFNSVTGSNKVQPMKFGFQGGGTQKWEASEFQYGLLLIDFSYVLSAGYGLDFTLYFDTQVTVLNSSQFGFFEVFAFYGNQTVESIINNTTKLNLQMNNTQSQISNGASLYRQYNGTNSADTNTRTGNSRRTDAIIDQSITTDQQRHMVLGLLIGTKRSPDTNGTSFYSGGYAVDFSYIAKDNISTTSSQGYDLSTYELIAAVTYDTVNPTYVFFNNDSGKQQYKDILFSQGNANNIFGNSTKYNIYQYQNISYAGSGTQFYYKNCKSLNLGRNVTITVDNLNVEAYGGGNVGNSTESISINGQEGSILETNSINIKFPTTLNNITVKGCTSVMQTFSESTSAGATNLTIKGNTTFDSAGKDLTFGNKMNDQGSSTTNRSPFTISFGIDATSDKVKIIANNVKVQYGNGTYAQYATYLVSKGTTWQVNSLTYEGRGTVQFEKSTIEATQALNLSNQISTSITNSTLNLGSEFKVTNIQNFTFKNNDITTPFMNLKDGVPVQKQFDLSTNTFHFTSTANSLLLPDEFQATFDEVDATFKSPQFLTIGKNSEADVTNSKIERDLTSVARADTTIATVFYVDGGKLNIDLENSKFNNNFSNGDKYTHIYLGDNSKLDDVYVDSLKAGDELSIGFSDKRNPIDDNVQTPILNIGFHLDETKNKVIVNNTDSTLYAYEVSATEKQATPSETSPENIVIKRHTHRYDDIYFNTTNLKTTFIEGEYFTKQGLEAYGKCYGEEDQQIDLDYLSFDTSPLTIDQTYVTITFNSAGKDIKKQLPITVKREKLYASVKDQFNVVGSDTANVGYDKETKLNLEELESSDNLQAGYEKLFTEGEFLLTAYNFDKEGTVSAGTRYRFTLDSTVLGEDKEFSSVLQLVDNTYTQVAILDKGSSTTPLTFETTNTGPILIIAKQTNTGTNGGLTPGDGTNIDNKNNNIWLYLIISVVGALFLLFVIAISAFILSRGRKPKAPKAKK